MGGGGVWGDCLGLVRWGQGAEKHCNEVDDGCGESDIEWDAMGLDAVLCCCVVS